MKKTKIYTETRFSAEVLRELVAAYDSVAESIDAKWFNNGLSVQHPDSEWSYDDLDEFYADYRAHTAGANLHLFSSSLSLHAQISGREAFVSVTAPSRSLIESIFSVLERATAISKLPASSADEASRLPTVFIGHGRSRAWRDLKDHLQDQHGVKVVSYESGARAGHTIRDILEELADTSTFALLVLTAEDEQANGSVRSRQNVVHETGLFQGKLGFARAIMVVEEGVEDFSNVHGVQQIRFAANNIREAFGDVLATLKREFPSAA